MDDHFTLQWNDYQNHLMNAFTSLRNDKDFVDLTLSCEGRKISSHKMLLSACSPYFRGLLKDNPCPHPVIILRQTSYEDLVAIIHFVYNGEVSLHQSRVKSFIKTAKSLKIRGLCEASEFGEEEERSPGIIEEQPSRKKVKLEEDEDEDFGGKDWSFDYGGGAGGDLQDESSTSNTVIAEGTVRVCKIVPQTKRYAQKFRDKWLNDPEFEPWLSRHETDPEKAICTVCRKTLNAKLYDLKHHSRSMRHRRNFIIEHGHSAMESQEPEEEDTRIYQSEEIIIKTTSSVEPEVTPTGEDVDAIDVKDGITLTHDGETGEITATMST